MVMYAAGAVRRSLFSAMTDSIIHAGSRKTSAVMLPIIFFIFRINLFAALSRSALQRTRAGIPSKTRSCMRTADFIMASSMEKTGLYLRTIPPDPIVSYAVHMPCFIVSLYFCLRKGSSLYRKRSAPPFSRFCHNK